MISSSEIGAFSVSRPGTTYESEKYEIFSGEDSLLSRLRRRVEGDS